MEEVKESNAVDNPAHYSGNGLVSCIEAINASLSKSERIGFYRGNALKYIWRAGKKDDASIDISKAEAYLKMWKEVLNEQA
jgi:hypothetical protein